MTSENMGSHLDHPQGPERAAGHAARSAIYVTTYYTHDLLEHNSVILSRLLCLKALGYNMLVIGRSPTREPNLLRTSYANVLLLDPRRGAAEQLAEMERLSGAPLDVALVIARDLPTARQALALGKRCACPVYYDSLETWTGYGVREGRVKPLRYLRSWLRERWHIRRFTRVITHSQTAKRYLERLHRLPPTLTGVLYAALPPPPPGPKGRLWRLAFGDAPRQGKVLVCSGGLSPGRGLHALIEAFQYVGQDYRLVLLGNGPLKAELAARASMLGLGGRVGFCPYVPVTDYYPLLGDADIGVDPRPLTNLNYDLACSVRVVDYANCRLPIITTATQGFRFIEREYGIVRCIPQGLGPREMGAMITEFADGYQSHPDRTRASLERALEREFSFQANVSRLEQWLREDGLAPEREQGHVAEP